MEKYENLNSPMEVPMEVPMEFDGENVDNYMEGELEDIDEILQWVSEESLENKNHRSFEGFEIYDTVDGNKKPEREVSFVIAEAGTYPQHVHKNSDAYFVVIDGNAVFVSGDKKFDTFSGSKIKIPRGTPHGFDIKEGDVFKFISIQNPPIKDHHTGEEDFHLYEEV